MPNGLPCSIIQRITKVIKSLTRIAHNSTVDTHSSRLIRSKGFLYLRSPDTDQLLFRIKPSSLQGRLCSCPKSRIPRNGSLTIAWIFAATILEPEYIVRKAGLSSPEFQELSIWACNEFYERTAKLIMKAKKGKLNNNERDWATLNEHLKLLYHLTNHYDISLMSHVLKLDVHVTDIVKDMTRKNLKSDDEKLTTSKWEKYIKDSLETQKPFQQLGTAISPEGWMHLKMFTQHWIEKLGEKSQCYS